MGLNTFIVVTLLGGLLVGRLFNLLKLTSVLGMVLFGIALSLVMKSNNLTTPFAFQELEPFLKSFALTVILLRAGLTINRDMLKRSGSVALFMSFVPGIIEAIALAVAFHLIFHFSWVVAALSGFMLAAVSPAVVIPSMLELQEKGYGSKRDVPTIILAGASLDDIVAITFFSLFLGMATSSDASVVSSLLSIPVTILLGIVPGVILGFLLTWYLHRFHENIRATEKVIVLLMCSLLLVDIGNVLHSAALLGVMAAGFMLLERAPIVAQELSKKLGSIWVFAQIMLFVFIGFAVDVPVALQAGFQGVGIIVFGLLFRSAGVMIATQFSSLTLSERLFCVIAYLPKATVQAALGGVALSKGLPEGELILAMAVLSIVVTAPLGLLGINLFGKKLLPQE